MWVFAYNIGKILLFIMLKGASLVAQIVQSLPAVQETQVQFLGQEDPLRPT